MCQHYSGANFCVDCCVCQLKFIESTTLGKDNQLRHGRIMFFCRIPTYPCEFLCQFPEEIVYHFRPEPNRKHIWEFNFAIVPVYHFWALQHHQTGVLHYILNGITSYIVASLKNIGTNIFVPGIRRRCLSRLLKYFATLWFNEITTALNAKLGHLIYSRRRQCHDFATSAFSIKCASLP